MHLAKFLDEAFDIKADERGIERALKSNAVKDMVVNVEGTKFKLTPDGIKYAEQMAGLTKGSGPASTAKGAAGK